MRGSYLSMMYVSCVLNDLSVFRKNPEDALLSQIVMDKYAKYLSSYSLNKLISKYPMDSIVDIFKTLNKDELECLYLDIYAYIKNKASSVPAALEILKEKYLNILSYDFDENKVFNALDNILSLRSI